MRETAADAPLAASSDQHAGRARPLCKGAGGLGESESDWQPASGELMHDAGFTRHDGAAAVQLGADIIHGRTGRAPAGRPAPCVFYGQEDGILASQLLRCQPGAYRLTHAALGDR